MSRLCTIPHYMGRNEFFCPRIFFASTRGLCADTNHYFLLASSLDRERFQIFIVLLILTGMGLFSLSSAEHGVLLLMTNAGVRATKHTQSDRDELPRGPCAGGENHTVSADEALRLRDRELMRTRIPYLHLMCKRNSAHPSNSTASLAQV